MATVAASFGLGTGNAAAAETNGERHCAVLVGKSTAGEASPVLARACDDTSPARARGKVLQTAPQAGAKSAPKPLAATALMLWYPDTNYRGTPTTVYGSAGTCDTAGYRLTPSDWWSRNLSSAKGVGACNVARFSNRAGNYSATFGLPVAYLGAQLNDNVGRVWVYHR